jgi:NADPH:quinone reductase-like Zn-dependent oxidoreductase
MGFGLRRPKVEIPGMEVAGEVAKIGPDVTRFRVGDAVFGVARGSFAEATRAREDRLAPRPVNLDSAQAASMAVSGVTALQAVRDHGRVQSGQRVLVIGASGGVGSHAVQLAKAAGAEVTAVCSRAKADFVRQLGADEVLDYASDDLPQTADFHVVLDIGGNRSLGQLRRCLTPRGALVLVGGEGGGACFGGTDRQIRALALAPFVRQKLRPFVAKERASDLLALKDLVEQGVLRPAVDRVLPLGEAADAITRLVEGRVRGKIVLAPHPRGAGDGEPR